MEEEDNGSSCWWAKNAMAKELYDKEQHDITFSPEREIGFRDRGKTVAVFLCSKLWL